ncbi:MAG: hypothetical protein IKA75_09155, partial [Bacteroidaceae bacterium]|nr:hypothetical protein [Bacteroidaceae bacterium]
DAAHCSPASGGNGRRYRWRCTPPDVPHAAPPRWDRGTFGIEYAARRAWEKPFRHHLDHQLTVKSQMRFRLFGKKK